jgi:2-polyprenyl-6-methoxyphenol hydroxylase-like FAD-dependent oxidoreductase
MLGLLLARTGIDVAVLEKHADFLRDFRGDTIHASTLELMSELGILDAFLKVPHQRVEELTFRFGDEAITAVDFRHLPTRCRFIAFMPQWAFLDFLVEQARAYPTFHLLPRADVKEPLLEKGRVVGVRAQTPQGPLEVRATLVVAADGRHSTLRAATGARAFDVGAPMDVLWFRLSRRPNEARRPFLQFGRGALLLLVERGDYYQSGLVVAKGSIEALQHEGIVAFRERIATIEPTLRDRLGEVGDWTDVNVLTVGVDRLPQWYQPGLLFIGDAAHTMSPVGGVGINLAIQDAVAAANLLAAPLWAGSVSERDLRRVQRRRETAVRVTQWLQVAIQNNILQGTVNGEREPTAPSIVQLMNRWRVLRRVPGRLIGVGIRPEHIKSPKRAEARKPETTSKTKIES